METSAQSKDNACTWMDVGETFGMRCQSTSEETEMKSVQIDLDSVEVDRAEKVKGNHTWKEILMMGIEVLEETKR